MDVDERLTPGAAGLDSWIGGGIGNVTDGEWSAIGGG